MKKKGCLLMVLSFCLMFSTIFANERNLEKSTTLQNNVPKVFRPITDLIKRIFGRKEKEPICSIPCQSVKNVILNKEEILDTDLNKGIEVFVKLEFENVMLDTIIYDYQISAGKIIGKGSKIVWDLTDVKSGTYMITAKVDNGCGFLGKSITKTITIKP